MNSPIDHAPNRVSRSSAPLAFSLLAAALALQGCVVGPPVQMRPVYLPPAVVAAPAPAAVAVAAVPAAPAEVDLMPPVPSFTTLADCESAYGPGSCGSGQAVYLSVGLTAPVAADTWFIPYAFGAMTGVLMNHYFAAPSAFVQGVDYHSFTASGVVNGYKTINQRQITRYNKAPAAVRSQLAHSGPARYSPSRGVITGKSTLAAANGARSTPTHSLGTPSPGSRHAGAAAAGRMTQSQGAHVQQARSQAPRPQTARSLAAGARQPHPAMSAPRSGAMPAARPQARPVARPQRVNFRHP